MITVNSMGARFASALAVGAVTIGSASVASANLSDVFFSIQASSGALSGTFEVMTDDVIYNPSNDSYMWFGSGISINDDNSGAPIATLINAFVFIQADPQVNMTFNVQAGAAPTAFSVSTAVLNFPSISSAEGQASVGFSLTDSDPFGAGDGEALLSGDGPGGNAYWAEYNIVPPGTVFTQQIPSLMISGDPSGSTSTGVDVPGGGLYLPIAGSVSSMQAHTAFTLSANDQASSTSQFTIIPEPASLLLVLMGVASLRRR